MRVDLQATDMTYDLALPLAAALTRLPLDARLVRDLALLLTDQRLASALIDTLEGRANSFRVFVNAGRHIDNVAVEKVYR